MSSYRYKLAFVPMCQHWLVLLEKVMPWNVKLLTRSTRATLTGSIRATLSLVGPRRSWNIISHTLLYNKHYDSECPENCMECNDPNGDDVTTCKECFSGHFKTSTKTCGGMICKAVICLLRQCDNIFFVRIWYILEIIKAILFLVPCSIFEIVQRHS